MIRGGGAVLGIRIHSDPNLMVGSGFNHLVWIRIRIGPYNIMKYMYKK